SRRTQRPNATSGITISGIASSTKPDNFGLVITIMAVAPMNSIMLRSAIDTDAPTADLIWVVSAVSRDTSSAERAESKDAGQRASAVAGDIGHQCQERPQLGAGLGRRLRQLALDEGLFIEQGVARRRAAGGFDLFHCAHEIRPVFSAFR